MLSFTTNRLINRPNPPRCKIIRKYLSDIGYTWPELEVDEAAGEEEEDTQEVEMGVEDADDGVGEEGEGGESGQEEFEEDEVVEERAMGGTPADPNTASKSLDSPTPLSGGPELPEQAETTPAQSSPRLPEAQISTPAATSHPPKQMITPEPRGVAPCLQTPPPVSVSWLQVAVCRDLASGFRAPADASDA